MTGRIWVAIVVGLIGVLAIIYAIVSETWPLAVLGIILFVGAIYWLIRGSRARSGDRE